MRSVLISLLLVFLLIAHPLSALAQEPALTWKAALLTGDDQLAVFDNARKTLKDMFMRMSIAPDNIRVLSATRAERMQGAIASSADNLEGALRDLLVGAGDACLVHMTSHGTRQGFFIRNGSTITPRMLNEVLDRTCGPQPTVVLISACYSGVFLNDAMLKPNRIILTAAAADRTSFGCSPENEYTYWDGCLIDNLAQTDNWKSLHEAVRRCVETKETQGRFRPSLPQAYFGEATADIRTPVAPVTTLDVAASRCLVAIDSSYGFTAANAIKIGLDAATGPARQSQYLNALRGPAGQTIRFRRIGTSPTADAILDIYELTYDGIEKPVQVYLDSYHFERPVAPAGFVCGVNIGLGDK